MKDKHPSAKRVMKIIIITIGYCFGIIFWYCIISGLFFPDDHKLATEDLGHGIKYYHDDPGYNIQGSIHSSHFFIPPAILNVSYNDSFIIVKQSPGGFEYWTMYPPYTSTFENDSIIYNNLKYPFGRFAIYHWIIDKTNYKVCGPLKKEDFIDSCRSLGIKLQFSRDDCVNKNKPKRRII